MNKIVIIGGGLSGLAAAYRLAKDHEVTVVEQDNTLGGMAQSYRVDDYYIEKFYHHFFSGDTELINLIGKLGLNEQIIWLTGKTGYYWDGRSYPMNTPLEILKFPPMSILDVFRLGTMVLRTRSIEDVRSYDSITARELIFKMGGKGVYDNFFQPLLRSKFGKNADEVSAAWLLGRVKIRSNRGAHGEKLGYMKGGFHKLVKAMAESIQQNGGRIITGNTAEKILLNKGRVEGVKLKEGTISCSKVISTVSPVTLGKLIDPEILGLDLNSIRYQGTCCALLGMSEPLLTDGTYWLNINADVPFGALIEHTNFMPVEDYGGQHLLYIASYFQGPDDPLYISSPEEIIEKFQGGLSSLFPVFKKDTVLWWKLGRDVQTAPVYETGYANKILPYRTKIYGLYLAGMFSKSNYPERSMNGSVKAGYEAAIDCLHDE